MLRLKAKINNKKLKYDQDHLDHWVAKQKDGEYTLGIKKWFKQRSLEENSYYWGVVVETLSRHTGYTPEEMHDALKTKFLPHMVDEFGLSHTTSTKALNTKGFEKYLEDIRRWAASDLGCIIPLPNEDVYD